LPERFRLTVEYHSLDQPLQLRVTSRFGWENDFENAIVFWPHRARGADGLRNTPSAASRLRERVFAAERGVRAKHRKNILAASRRVPVPGIDNKYRRLYVDFPPTKLQPDGIERGITSDAYYHVKLEDGRTGYVSAFELLASATDVDPAQAAAECKRRSDPRLACLRNRFAPLVGVSQTESIAARPREALASGISMARDDSSFSITES
jgi:hypothetical protein